MERNNMAAKGTRAARGAKKAKTTRGAKVAPKKRTPRVAKKERADKPARQARTPRKATPRAFVVRVYGDGTYDLKGSVTDTTGGIATIEYQVGKNKFIKKVAASKVVYTRPGSVTLCGRHIIDEFYATKVAPKDGVVFVQTVEGEKHVIGTEDYEIIFQEAGVVEEADEEVDPEDEDATDDGDDDEADSEDEEVDPEDEDATDDGDDDEDEAPKSKKKSKKPVKKSKKSADEDDEDGDGDDDGEEAGDDEWDML